MDNERNKKLLSDFLGIKYRDHSDICNALSKVGSTEFRRIYQNQDKLSEVLRNCGANEIQINQVCIMCNVTGFEALIDNTSDAVQVDIERYIQNAIFETGFNRKTILELASAIFLGLDIACDHETYLKAAKEGKQDSSKIFLVPIKDYENELKNLKYVLSLKPDDEVFDADIKKLMLLVSSGIPEAKYYLGYILITSKKFREFEKKGFKLLKEASDEGCVEASLLLADEIYNISNCLDSSKLTKAYELYTGSGVTGLNKEQRERVNSIISMKSYNANILKLCSIFAIILVVLFAVSPMISLFSNYLVLGIISHIIIIGVLVVGYLHYRTAPYDLIIWVPIGMFIVWTIYMLIRIIL